LPGVFQEDDHAFLDARNGSIGFGLRNGCTAPSAEAAYGGITAAANWQHGGAALGRHIERCGLRCRTGANVCEDSCYTVMKTMTRTVYDRVTEQREMVVYDTVWEKQSVQDVKRVAEVQSRVEQFTYQRPVYETITQQVPFTVQRPYVETRTCDVAYTSYARSYETRVQSVPYTVYNTVCETTTRTVYYRVPRQVCGTKTIQVRTGRWETRIIEYPRVAADGKGAQKTEVSQKGDAAQKGDVIRICRRVWVPCIETREVPYTKTVYELQTMEVPHTVKRVVPEVRTRDVEYTVCRMVPVTQTRTVSYQVLRSIPEHRMRTVSGVVERQITEVGTRTVPYTTIREVPVTRTVTVPRQVPRTVICTVVRTVPRQECYQVPVRICVPTQKGDPGKKGDPARRAATTWGGEVPKPFLDSSPASDRPAAPIDAPNRSA
jgi:hypothetical protein